MTAFGSLVDLYEKTGIECLNEDERHPVQNALYQSNLELPLQSLDDEQLLIRIPFSQAVKIAEISIKCKDEKRAPKLVKLFVNDSSIDFSSASEDQPTQTLTLSAEQVLSGKNIPLRFVNFQKVRHLTIFVESNQGGEDLTAIGSLRFFGCPEAQLDMKDWKPTQHEEAS